MSVRSDCAEEDKENEMYYLVALVLYKLITSTDDCVSTTAYLQ